MLQSNNVVMPKSVACRLRKDLAGFLSSNHAQLTQIAPPMRGNFANILPQFLVSSKLSIDNVMQFLRDSILHSISVICHPYIYLPAS